MSYSACDFLASCEENTDAYNVPEVTPKQWRKLTGEAFDATDESQQQRILAERVARAFDDRKRYRGALRHILRYGGDAATIAADALDQE